MSFQTVCFSEIVNDEPVLNCCLCVTIGGQQFYLRTVYDADNSSYMLRLSNGDAGGTDFRFNVFSCQAKVNNQQEDHVFLVAESLVQIANNRTLALSWTARPNQSPKLGLQEFDRRMPADILTNWRERDDHRLLVSHVYVDDETVDTSGIPLRGVEMTLQPLGLPGYLMMACNENNEVLLKPEVNIGSLLDSSEELMWTIHDRQSNVVFQCLT